MMVETIEVDQSRLNEQRTLIIKCIELLMKYADDKRVLKIVLEDIARLSGNGLLVAVVRHTRRDKLNYVLNKIHYYLKHELDDENIVQRVKELSGVLTRALYIVRELYRYRGWDPYNYVQRTVYCGIGARKKKKKIILEIACSHRIITNTNKEGEK